MHSARLQGRQRGIERGFEAHVAYSQAEQVTACLRLESDISKLHQVNILQAVQSDRIDKKEGDS